MYANLQARIASTLEYYMSYGTSYVNNYTYYLPLPIILESCLLTGDLLTLQLYIKKGNKKEPKNYRPVSLTSVICKIMESIVRDIIMDNFFFK